MKKETNPYGKPNGDKDNRAKSRQFEDGGGKPRKHTSADRRAANQDVRDFYR